MYSFIQICKPVHDIVLQSNVSTVLPTHPLPPQDGIGLLQLLVFFLTPPSHNFEQFLADQLDQPPSTAQYKHYMYMLNP